MHIVSNVLFWFGVIVVVGNYIMVTLASRKYQGTGTSVTFSYDNLAAAALVLLSAAVARYLGW